MGKASGPTTGNDAWRTGCVDLSLVNNNPPNPPLITGGFDAASARLTVLDPDRNVVYEETVATSVTAGASATVAFTYTVPPIIPPAPLSGKGGVGIWHVDYTLLYANGHIIQPQAETDSGRFVVANPPENPYKSPDFNFSVVSDAEYYQYGSPATFTFNLWNNTDTNRQIRAMWGLPHHYNGNFFNVAEKTVNVPAHGQTSFTYVLDKVLDLDRLRAKFYDEAGAQAGYAEKGIRVVNPSIAVAVTTDKTAYIEGDTVLARVQLKNKKSDPADVSLKVKVIDPSGATVYSNDSIEMIAEWGDAATVKELGFALSTPPIYGFYKVFADVYDAGGRKVGEGRVAFEMPRYFVSATPTLPASFGPSNPVSFDLKNIGTLAVPTLGFTASLRDPGNLSVWDASRAVDNVLPGETARFDFTVPLTGVRLGDYKLRYASDAGGRLSEGETVIPASVGINVSFDRTVYRVRQAVAFTVSVRNTGMVDMSDAVVTVNSPDAGYTASRSTSIPVGGTTSAGLCVHAA